MAIRREHPFLFTSADDVSTISEIYKNAPILTDILLLKLFSIFGGRESFRECAIGEDVLVLKVLKLWQQEEPSMEKKVGLKFLNKNCVKNFFTDNANTESPTIESKFKFI